MGLDQYAYARDKKGNVEELAYWRKHYPLDEWMQGLWEGIREHDDEYRMNGQELPLDSTDISYLEECVKSDDLPPPARFADDSFDKIHKEETLKFIKEAKKALKEGKEVYYENSW